MKTAKILFILSCIICLCSCKKNTSIVGNWNQTNYISGSPYTPDQVWSPPYANLNGAFISLSGDGRFTYSESYKTIQFFSLIDSNETVSGTYHMSHDSIIFYDSRQPNIPIVTTILLQNDKSLNLQWQDSMQWSPGSPRIFFRIQEFFTR